MSRQPDDVHDYPMPDHEYIYLQPECCADTEMGRVWCQDDSPEECEGGQSWTKYVRADLYEQQAKELKLLHCLQAAGVDNWSGYDEAYNRYEDK